MSAKTRERITFAAFIAPNLALFLVFTYWPLVYSGWLSVLDWRLPAREGVFVGLGNYAVLASDGATWRVWANSVVYAVAVVAAAQVIAFPLAVLLNQRVPGRAVFRTAAFLPYVTTSAAAALVFVLLLHPRMGPLSVVYDAANVEGPNLLGSSSLALVAIIAVGAWREIGIATVFYLAGLQNLSRSFPKRPR